MIFTCRTDAFNPAIGRPHFDVNHHLHVLRDDPPTADQLGKVPGVSADMAKAIVDTRAKSGAFKSADDLMKVPGMTKEKVDAMAPALSFGAAKSAGDEEETKLPRY